MRLCGYKLPEQFSCPECQENKDYRIHTAFQKDLPDGDWSWHIMNHDKTSKFQWPEEFQSKSEAQAHMFGIMEYED